MTVTRLKQPPEGHPDAASSLDRAPRSATMLGHQAPHAGAAPRAAVSGRPALAETMGRGFRCPSVWVRPVFPRGCAWRREQHGRRGAPRPLTELTRSRWEAPPPAGPLAAAAAPSAMRGPWHRGFARRPRACPVPRLFPAWKQPAVFKGVAYCQVADSLERPPHD